MPATALSLDAAIGWTLTHTQAPFANRVQGPDNFSFNLGAIDVAVWDEVYASTTTLNPGDTVTLDLRTFTNLDAESVTITKAHSLFLLPSGGDVTIRPGALNPLVWFFGDASTKLTAYDGGVFINPKAGSDTVGVTVDATHRNIALINGSGSATTTVTAIAIVGT